MLRRDFIRRSSLALAGGLLVGDEVLEQFARLTHVRKSFPSAALHRGGPTIITDAELHGILREVYAKFRMDTQHLVTPLVAQSQTKRKVREVYYDFDVRYS